MAKVTVSLVGVTVDLDDEDEGVKPLVKIAKTLALDLIDEVERLAEGEKDVEPDPHGLCTPTHCVAPEGKRCVAIVSGDVDAS